MRNQKLKWCILLTGSLLLFGALTYLLLHLVLVLSGNESVQDFGDFSNVLSGDDLTNHNLWANGRMEDPYLSDNSTQVWAHSNNGDGNGILKLEILNALDEDWQTLFDTVIQDWSQSSVLDLYPKRVDVDYQCSRVQGAMKICNANFGETGYLGFNEVEYMGNVILSSVAQMNEYYLYNADDTQRQYTLCHELGHGFGLPHTDENPYNTDLGNCMDYTLKPENNLHPGESNFQRLASMYMDTRQDENIGQQQQQYISEQYEQQQQQQYDPEQSNYYYQDQRNRADNNNGPQHRQLRRVVKRHYFYMK